MLLCGMMWCSVVLCGVAWVRVVCRGSVWRRAVSGRGISAVGGRAAVSRHEALGYSRAPDTLWGRCGC